MEALNHPSSEDLSSYALQALDPNEAQSVAEHLLTCQECRQQLKAYSAVADGLLFAVPPKTPPAQLRSSLEARIAAGRPVAAPPRRGFRFSIFQAALGAAVVVLLAVTAYLAYQVNDLKQQQQALLQLLQQNQTSLALISQLGVSVIPLQTNQVAGNIVISPDGQNGVLFVHGLSPLDPNHTYQVWLIPASGSPQSAGVFQVPQNQSTSYLSIRSPVPIQDFSNIGITVEPSGGSQAPTTEPILLDNI